MIPLFLAFFVILTVTESVEYGGSTTWAFDKHSFEQGVSYNNERNSILLKNFDFGPFGASKVSLGIKTASALKSFKDKVSVHFDTANSFPLELEFSTSSQSGEESVLTFDLASPEGVHDMYISIPSNVQSSDLSSVQFYAGLPIRDQWYYLVSLSSGKVMYYWQDPPTLTFLGSSSFYKFKFENVTNDGFYKIVPYRFPDHALAVTSNSTEKRANIVAEPYTGSPSQIWLMQMTFGGYRFHPKPFFNGCLALIDGLTEVGSAYCDASQGQIWNFARAC